MRIYIVSIVLKFRNSKLKTKGFMKKSFKIYKFQDFKVLYFTQIWSKSITIFFVFL